MINGKVFEYLKKQYGCNISTAFYSNIDVWRDWWRGFHQPFHHYKWSNGSRLLDRDMFTLKMAKKVCEDWAAILLNQKTQIIIDDKKTDIFLQGENENGGVLGCNKFWRQGNALMEKAFYSGTGAVTIRFTGLKVAANGALLRTPKTVIKLSFLSAEHIIILSKDNDNITEAAFCSHLNLKGTDYIYLEVHTLDSEGNYIISNKYFKEENGTLTEAPLPSGMLSAIHTHSPVPLFAIVSPNIVSNIDGGNGLGQSVFSDALDTLKGIDIAYNNLCCDFKLGAKKVFMNKSLLDMVDGKTIAPDDINQQLFSFVGDELTNADGGKQLVQEHNPLLRTEENTKGIQAQLDYLSFKVGFGTKHYQFNAGSIVTATQYTGDKQDLIQNANKHYTAVEEFLLQLVRGILWAGKNVLGADINPEAELQIKFDESALIDEAAERAKDAEDINLLIMQPWEYRVKWYGETKEQALEVLSEVQSDDDIMGFGG